MRNCNDDNLAVDESYISQMVFQVFFENAFANMYQVSYIIDSKSRKILIL